MGTDKCGWRSSSAVDYDFFATRWRGERSLSPDSGRVRRYAPLSWLDGKYRIAAPGADAQCGQRRDQRDALQCRWQPLKFQCYSQRYRGHYVTGEGAFYKCSSTSDDHDGGHAWR